MSRIVFFCIPAHGHTNPTLGVVKELVCRGHEVWYYSYNIMREKIESLGATFVSCDDYDIETKLKSKDSSRIGKDIAFSTKILVDTTLALDHKVCSEMAELKPDCIVADSMALWGKAIALKLNIPLVSSTTTFATSSANGLSSIIFTPMGLLVMLLAIRICCLTYSPDALPAAIMPRPPPLETAAASLPSAIQAIPP